jgi:hypothetical protein
MSIELNELKTLCLEMFKQKAAVQKIKDEKSLEEKKLKELQESIIDHLEAHDLKTFDTGFGKVTRKNQPYAKITDKAALSDFLKDRGIYEDLVTFNAATMNSFYKEEMEKAKAEMNLDFQVNGMEITSNRKTLSVTGVKL